MIGLTNYIEVITINVIGSSNFGRNQFDLLDPSQTKLVKEAAGKLSIQPSSYNVYLRTGDTLKSISRNDELTRNSSIVFVHTGISVGTTKRLEELVKTARLTKSGADRFPYILPSRDKSFR